MTKDDQKLLLSNFCDQVKEALLLRSDRWPENWDGHELRELVAYAFELERTAVMRQPRSKRRRECKKYILMNSLY